MNEALEGFNLWIDSGFAARRRRGELRTHPSRQSGGWWGIGKISRSFVTKKPRERVVSGGDNPTGKKSPQRGRRIGCGVSEDQVSKGTGEPDPKE